MSRSYAHEAITVADTAIGFTAAKLKDTKVLDKGVSRVVCTVETAQIRFTVDGTTPTSSVGHIANVGDVIEVDGVDAPKFLAIRSGGSSGAIMATYEID